MELLTEYLKQQEWRNWEQYLAPIPLKETDHILDLGCSIGRVTRLFSGKAEKVIGIDSNAEFIEFCNKAKVGNEEFHCVDFLEVEINNLGPISGVWASFSLSYLDNPNLFLKQLYDSLLPSGWIALLDVSCFISGNMNKSSPYYDKVKTFELNHSTKSGYDFNFGEKMKSMLEHIGFQIEYFNTDVTDLEINFNGNASKDVLEAWQARLDRMPKLKQYLGHDFEAFKLDFISHLQSESHQQRQNLKYVVATK